MTTHSLLEELRGLGVQLSTDGITLHIDAPKGVITPDLWEQIAALKQDLITLLAQCLTGLDEDERLHTFASTISHMVDVLGGPGTVRITKHDPSQATEELTRESRSPYQGGRLSAATVCRAVWHLNEQGERCKAREKVAREEECGCTVWVQSEEGAFCAKCYTPRHQPETHQ